MLDLIVTHLDLMMFAAAIVLLLRGYPVAFTLAGVGILFAVIGVYLEQGDFAGGFSFLKFYYNRIFGLMNDTNEVLVAVPLFIFMGVMLERSNVAGELLTTMGRLFGAMRGGLGISVVIVGMLLAASTGIVGATVVTMGLISLPTMLKHNYSKSLSCGAISASGTLGQIIPPSIVLVILGDTIGSEYQQARQEINQKLQQEAWAEGNFAFTPPAIDPVSVGDLFAGALFPGLLLVGLYLAWVLFVSFTSPNAAPPIAIENEEDKVGVYDIFRVLIPPISLIVAVLGSIMAGIATPTEAAAVGAIGAILLAGERMDESNPWPAIAALIGIIGALTMTQYFDLRLTQTNISQTDQIAVWVAGGFCLLIAWGVVDSLFRAMRFRDPNTGKQVLTDVMQATTKVSVMVFTILIGAQLFNLSFRGLGGEGTVEEFLSAMPGGPVGAMVAVMLLMFILGFFLDFLEIIFVVIPIVAPVLFKMELDPIWVAILIAINLQTSFLTPPFGFALFYLRGVAPPEVKTTDIYRGVFPFVIIQLVGLTIVWFIPELATWLPNVVFG